MTRSENMARVKSSGTSPEKRLAKAMWKAGLRYRKQCRDIFGNPDFCFRGKKVAVFCDSEFWHGKLYLEGKSIPKKNREFWIKKFEKNVARDEEVNEILKKEGWTVLRFWQKEIEKDPDACVTKIKKTLQERLR